jgi:hypothetical protein
MAAPVSNARGLSSSSNNSSSSDSSAGDMLGAVRVSSPGVAEGNENREPAAYRTNSYSSISGQRHGGGFGKSSSSCGGGLGHGASSCWPPASLNAESISAALATLDDDPHALAQVLSSFAAAAQAQVGRDIFWRE